MEQRAVVRFFTPKGLKVRAIHTEPESVYGPEAFALPITTKWQKRFHQGRTDLFDDPRSARSLTIDLAGVIGSMLEEIPSSSCKELCRHFRIRTATSLRILHDKLGLKNHIFTGCRMPFRSTRRAKE
jgi:hypothetical protein